MNLDQAKGDVMTKIYDTKEEVLIVANSAKGVPFNQLDNTGRLSSKKGGIGQMVEENVFGMSVNSDSAPDFKNLGIELKVTPFIKNNNKIRAKERLVLNIINYMEENFDSFYDSHFWYKNKSILMMFYEYQKQRESGYWYIDEFILYTWPEEDLLIILNDWKIIANKIKSGKAHEISESDTMYLAACTKGATAASSLRQQPMSPIMAKQRAYSLKNSYMTYILNHYVYGKETDERIIKSTDVLKEKTFEEVIVDMFKPYIGKSQQQLIDEFNIVKSKRTNASIVNKILMVNDDVSKSIEFQKANIIPKTIRIESNGTIKESMSFATFKFKELIEQQWEESDFYNFIAESKFMFVIFKKVDATEENAILNSVMFWGMPEDDVEEAKKCWETTVKVIKEGVQLNQKGKYIENNLPKSKDNVVAHVRPHASKAYYKFDDVEIGSFKDGNELPDGRWMTTQCFWINNSYIRSILKNRVE